MLKKTVTSLLALLHVDRRWLYGIAGVIWSAVGFLLLGYAVAWLAPVGFPMEVAIMHGGAIVAAVFIRYVFLGVARKNITRIEEGPQRASALAFQNWRGYLITVFMIGLGIILRHSSLPKPGLAVVYLGIGLALLAGSAVYHRRFFAPPAA